MSPRAAWGQPPLVANNLPGQSSSTLPSSNQSRGLSPIQDSPVELPAPFPAPTANPNSDSSQTRKRGSDAYVEDIDPRFAEPESRTAPTELPSALVPGFGANPPPLAPVVDPSQQQLHRNDPSPQHSHPSEPTPPGLERDSYEDIAEGARSPAASEASHFTSVSQRGINPNWRPPPPGAPQGAGSYGPYQGAVRRPRQEDVILEANPDFIVPAPSRGRGRGSTANVGGRQPGMIPPLAGQGRYPGPEAL